VSRFTFGPYGDGFPMHYPSLLKRMIRSSNRVVTSFDGLRQMEVEIGKNVKPLRTPHGLKVVARRRAANKVARQSRKRNRR
jgi:hypothetical protein